MPVRARSSAWIAAMASLPPSRSARTWSSSASTPTAIVASSPSCSGGRSTSVSRTLVATSAHPSHLNIRLPTTPTSLSRRAARSTSGSRPSDAPSAASSRGVARPDDALPASRSTSRTPSSAVRRASRAAGSRTSASTASSRRSIASRSTSGASSHCRSSRDPIAVIVRSSTASNVPAVSLDPAPRVASGRSDSTSSRFRRVISSSGITPPARSTTGRARCGTPAGCISFR
jgi:hypothetical protein